MGSVNVNGHRGDFLAEFRERTLAEKAMIAFAWVVFAAFFTAIPLLFILRH